MALSNCNQANNFPLPPSDYVYPSSHQLYQQSFLPIFYEPTNKESDNTENGYWNLPKINYGPLASSTPCKAKKVRIGKEYQANIPMMSGRKKSLFKDECVWDAQRIKNKDALNEYLKIVQFVIGTSRSFVYTDCHYDEERALFLLKAHNYSIGDALKSLSLCRNDYHNHSQNQNEEENENENENKKMSVCDEDICFLCGDGGNLLICDDLRCDRVWHIHCAGLQTMPSTEKWFCPNHKCCLKGCKKEIFKDFECSYCGNSYCADHCPSECQNYKFSKIEFLCAVCLSESESASQRFLSRLMEVHRRKNNENISKKCKLSKRVEIEWFDLYSSVISNGGLSKMQQISAWDKVRKDCGLNKSFQAQNIWKSLKNHYEKYLLCYQQKYRKNNE